MEMESLPRNQSKSRTTSTTSLIQRYDHSTSEEAPLELGLPEKRNYISYTHLTAVLVSLSCLVLGIVTVAPSVGLAWRLRFSGQIVVLGFLLSIMNICLQTITTFTFLLLEARFGNSRLQNFEAILLGRFIASRVSTLWRIALLGLLVLPLGLSIAYKRLLGGTASGHFTSSFSGDSYGIGFPALGSENWQNEFLFSAVTSIAAFRRAALSAQSTYPRTGDFPVAYGYNVLLLNNDASSVLDMPTMEYLTSLQAQLLANETLNINATIYAYQATYNASTTDLQTNDELWSNIVQSGSIQEGLSTIELFRGPPRSRLGMMPFGNDSQVLFAAYPNSTSEGGVMSFSIEDNAELAQFRKQAQIFSLKRARCRGYWSVTTTSISLVEGSCDASTVDSEVLHQPNMLPYKYTALPVFQLLSRNLTQNPDSPWLRPIYATSLATMYWARGLQMLSENGSLITYAPMDETLTITRNILRAEAALYLVLAIQPALTILGFAVAIWLHKVPIGRNFGIVSILSGLDSLSVALLSGAGLSGRLREPVRLTVTPQSTSSLHSTSGLNDPTERIRYVLKPETISRKEPQIEIPFLIRGRKYL
ncbi:hypothetical protein BU25DRAFT_89324 [Macroventuria anomochaeta]|uniref:Uncharacterized protein n=1 Tax=Macroventuria anomochaeta TaxID=301207 RepID=A0ACB6SFP9_9PLEO|nr:uncharacterized protein BU25DRAFT_89324 [Macroventuria anomochaeta]KAF2633135.1 hypothetical protein BU25DRAFT_89324 [Macroventuria anomochaeta]